jgi:L-threonylcarbamoyladenylate synthase
MSDLSHAVDVLEQGGLVAFPSETVYGLGADAENPQAVARIYAAKGRPSNHPVIVHVAPEADLAYWAARVPAQARALVHAFWPGPLTLVLKRAPGISDCVSGGQDSIALRCPSHPVAQQLLRAFAARRASGQAGVAGPSANKFGQVSPTLAAHVRSEFPELVAAGMPVIEGGASEVGIESTIVDLSRVDQGVGPVLLRPGHITAEQISEVLGVPVQGADAHAPRVSGALKSHYAPQTPLQLGPIDALRSAASNPQLAQGQRLVIVSHSLPRPDSALHPQVDWVAAPSDAVAYGRSLYASLRALDRMGYASMLWEQVPDGPGWRGVRDRLSRAAAAF